MSSLGSRLSKINLNSNIVDDLKWQLALEYSDIGMWDYDAQEDKVYFSETSKKIIGVSDPFFGRNVQDWNNLVHPDDKKKYLQDFQDHLNGKTAMYINEHRVRSSDGNYKWIRDRGKIVEWTNDNQPKRIIGTHTDITAQKQNEETISDSLSLVTEHNNRLRSFAHIVTHNLKQHTSNFESLLEFYDESEDPEEKKEIIEQLHSLSQSLTKTIVNLHDVVHVHNNKSNKVKKIYIAKEINHILNLLKLPISENNATIHNNVHKKIFVYYNYSYFESIIQNLLSNAIKYKHPDRDPVISIDFSFDQKEFKLMISDNGMGIDLDKFGNDVFGLYKTFHYNSDAEGVGLYLIKSQIESFGGSISVDSKVGEGTTFTITSKNRKKA